MTNRSSDVTGSFADTLGSYIGKSGYSVQKLAQMTGLGRSAIQHTLSGKLMPAKAFVDRLSAALPLTPDQRKSLTEQYMREKAGDAAYYNRSNIRDIIEGPKNYRVESGFSSVEVAETIDLDDSLHPINGNLNINRLIRAMLFNELLKKEPEIITTIPFDEDSDFFSMAVQIFASAGKKISLEHYFRIAACPEGGKNPNMILLKNALRTAVCPSLDYKPYYHYTDNHEKGFFMLPYPYFLITSEYSVLISEDLSGALATKSAELNGILRTHAERMRRHSQLMIRPVDNHDILSSYSEAASLYKSSIDFQPFIMPYISEDIVNKRLTDFPDRKELLSAMHERYFLKENRQSSPKHISYFTQNGLIDFAESGVMKNIPGQFLTPMDKPERLHFFESMKANMCCFSMLEENFRIPPFMQVICLTNNRVVIFCMLENEKKFACLIKEPALCCAFDDFLSSLGDLGLTRNSSIMSAAIDKCIDMLK